MKDFKILFVCSGNTCRSPMAEAYANFKYRCGDKISVTAKSAGLFVSEDSINPCSAEALSDYGIPSVRPHAYLLHTPKQISEQDLAWSDLTVCMNGAMAQRLSLFFPNQKSKITAFKNSVGDPYGGDSALYRECLAEIIRETDKLITELLKNESDV